MNKIDSPLASSRVEEVRKCFPEECSAPVCARGELLAILLRSAHLIENDSLQLVHKEDEKDFSLVPEERLKLWAKCGEESAVVNENDKHRTYLPIYFILFYFLF